MKTVLLLQRKTHPLFIAQWGDRVAEVLEKPVPTSPDTRKMGRAFAKSESADRLRAENLASTAAARCQHAAAIFGRHTGAEAMHLAALTFFRLIGTEHTNTPCRSIVYGVCATSKRTRRIPQNNHYIILAPSFPVKQRVLIFHYFPFPLQKS